eukprot:768661-Hanusia_phi.AAC.6
MNVAGGGGRRFRLAAPRQWRHHPRHAHQRLGTRASMRRNIVDCRGSGSDPDLHHHDFLHHVARACWEDDERYFDSGSHEALCALPPPSSLFLSPSPSPSPPSPFFSLPLFLSLSLSSPSLLLFYRSYMLPLSVVTLCEDCCAGNQGLQGDAGVDSISACEVAMLLVDRIFLHAQKSFLHRQAMVVIMMIACPFASDS